MTFLTFTDVFQTITPTLEYSVCRTMWHHQTLCSTGEELSSKEQALSAVLRNRTHFMCTDHCLNWLTWIFGQFPDILSFLNYFICGNFKIIWAATEFDKKWTGKQNIVQLLVSCKTLWGLRKFEVFMAVRVIMTLYWVLALCRPIGRCRCFREAYCFYL